MVKYRVQFDNLQSALQADPLNSQLFLDVSREKHSYDYWLKIEEHILHQKSKIHWLQCGDGNNIFFHASLKNHRSPGISCLYNVVGILLSTGVEIKEEVVGFYRDLLGTYARTDIVVDLQIVHRGTILDSLQKKALLLPVTSGEVLDSMNSTGDNKAPGSNGFSTS